MTDEPAYMSSWMVVRFDGNDCLFGFADRHVLTGGLSWVLSSPLIELDEVGARATTSSGRRYILGTRITVEELDDEGQVARDVLVLRKYSLDVARHDLAWLVACKWSRHLCQPAPDRSDREAVERLLQLAREQYRLLRTGGRIH